MQLPQNYVWQAAAPSYAQATLSLWSELLFDGHLVDAAPADGGMPSPSLSQDCGYSMCGYQPKAPGQSWWYPELLEQSWPEPKTYRLWGGHGQGLVIIARKHETRNQFVIIGSVQPQSNVVGNAPLNATATIKLEGVQLNFTVRRQGSVYLYSPSLAADTPPSFVQLDGWHQVSHFSWWANDFTIEAELHVAFKPTDVAAGGLVQTEVRTWGVGDLSHDLTQARAFVSLSSELSSSFAYEFEPRPVSRSELTEVNVGVRSYRVEVVMRGAACLDPVSDDQPTISSCVTLRLAAGAKRIGVACVGQGTWERVAVGSVLRLKTATVHRVLVEATTGCADVDLLKVVEVMER